MPYWDEAPYKIVTNFPLPPDVISIMYTDNDITRRLDNNEDPVLLSIEKWERILRVYSIISELRHPYAHYSEIYKFIGYRTCALCIVSIRNFEKMHGPQRYKEDKCSVCPLAQIERCIDETSAFHKIESILEYSFRFGDSLKGIDTYKQQHKELGVLLVSFTGLLKCLQR